MGLSNNHTVKSLFISPHDDDNVLFGAFTCMREKPLVVVVTDSFRQPMRGEVGCGAVERMLETKKACEILGCPVFRMGVPDTYFEGEPRIFEILQNMFACFQNFDMIYVPALQGGNSDHDMISRAAQAAFGNRVRFYSTYTKTDLAPTGTTEVIPTEEEMELKNKALECFVSQINLPATKPHFEAIRGKSEWLL